MNLDADLEHLEDLPAPLLPENLDEKQKTNFQDQSFGANQTTLEDYLSVSDNMSLLSLDMSGQNISDQLGEQDSLIFHRGFSAQSSSIPVFQATVPLNTWLLPKIRQIAAWVKQSHLPLPLHQ